MQQQLCEVTRSSSRSLRAIGNRLWPIASRAERCHSGLVSSNPRRPDIPVVDAARNWLNAERNLASLRQLQTSQQTTLVEPPMQAQSPPSNRRGKGLANVVGVASMAALAGAFLCVAAAAVMWFAPGVIALGTMTAGPLAVIGGSLAAFGSSGATLAAGISRASSRSQAESSQVRPHGHSSQERTQVMDQQVEEAEQIADAWRDAFDQQVSGIEHGGALAVAQEAWGRTGDRVAMADALVQADDAGMFDYPTDFGPRKNFARGD